MKKLLSLVVCCLLFSLFPSLSYAEVFALGTPTITMPIPSKQEPDWGIIDTNVQKWWRQGFTGKGVRIAVIDTGVDIHHPDLKGVITGGSSAIKGDPYFIDQNGHGTFVAGQISALNNSFGSVGVAYGAKIFAVKALDKYGHGTVAELVSAINWCIVNKMQIINMSLGITSDDINTPDFKRLEYEINLAYSKGILIVAASGNDGINKVSYPANFPNVIAVGGAYEDYNDVTRKISIGWADFSNYSSKIEVIAPSTFVYSTFPMNLTPFLNKYKGYDYMVGTSMASPYVCGFLAILKQKYPHDSVNMLRHRLHMNTIPVSPQGKTGYGFIYAKY